MIKKYMYLFLTTLIIISCGGNYSGNEDEVLNSVTCLNKYNNIFCIANTPLDNSEKNCSQTGLGSSSNLWMATDKCTLNEPKFYCSDQGTISIKNYQILMIQFMHHRVLNWINRSNRR